MTRRAASASASARQPRRPKRNAAAGGSSWDEPIYFDSPSALGHWLSANHSSKTELFVGYYKKHTGRAALTWSNAVDEALCWGWIDGVRRRIDEDRMAQRFTPRAKKSHWSRINVEKMALLEAAGRVRDPGKAAFALRTEENTAQMSFERDLILSDDFAKRLAASKAAATYFQGRTPGYRRQVTHWIMSAKRPETQERRLEELIENCANSLDPAYHQPARFQLVDISHHSIRRRSCSGAFQHLMRHAAAVSANDPNPCACRRISTSYARGAVASIQDQNIDGIFLPIRHNPLGGGTLDPFTTRVHQMNILPVVGIQVDVAKSGSFAPCRIPRGQLFRCPFVFHHSGRSGTNFSVMLSITGQDSANMLLYLLRRDNPDLITP
ncbi:hypothetical protein SCUP234_01051 [Seiridium cupressi]